MQNNEYGGRKCVLAGKFYYSSNSKTVHWTVFSYAWQQKRTRYILVTSPDTSFWRRHVGIEPTQDALNAPH